MGRVTTKAQRIVAAKAECERRRELWRQVHRMLREDVPKAEIARALRSDKKTVARYAATPVTPAAYTPPPPKVPAPRRARPGDPVAPPLRRCAGDGCRCATPHHGTPPGWARVGD